MKRLDIFALSLMLGVSIVLASLLVYATAYKRADVVVVGSTASASPTTAALTASVPSTVSVTIPHADRFEPVFAEVAVGGTVTWQNQDTDGHTVVAMPTDPLEFKLSLGPRSSGSYTFKQAGVYGYYCDAHSMYDPATGLVKADKGTDAYPVSMYGVILVVDPSLPIAGGRTKVVVPGADRFQPLATVVHAGSTVAWTNIDSDPHSIFSPPNAAQQLRLVVGPGKSSEYTFAGTGVYAYYCNLHATWNASLQRVQALPGTSEYPAAMEGVVFVLP